MKSYLKELARWWELKRRLRKVTDAKERSTIRRSVSAKYAKRKQRSRQETPTL